MSNFFQAYIPKHKYVLKTEFNGGKKNKSKNKGIGRYC